MLTLIGSALGFATSFAPKLLGLWEARQDRKHELAMIETQADAQAKLQEGRVEEAVIDAGIREIESMHRHDAAALQGAHRWVKSLAASVRPVITYAFWIEFATLTILLAADVITESQYHKIWDQDMKAIFAAIVSYWFGSRTFNRKSHT